MQSTHAPTPLGILYHNTHLNHVGYSLDRTSVLHLCNDTGVENEKDCFETEANAWQFQWDNRHFAVESDLVLYFVERFILPPEGAVRCKDLLEAQEERFTLYNVWCHPENVTNATTNVTLALKHYYREDISKIVRKHNEQIDLLPHCPLPQSSPAWNYYYTLVAENAKKADVVKRATSAYSSNTVREEDRLATRIPHRLIFTHKDDLFNCSNSAKSPELYNFGENAKFTVNAYSRIWPDLEYVFLTNNDCIGALNQAEPGLVPWFNALAEGIISFVCFTDVCTSVFHT